MALAVFDSTGATKQLPNTGLDPTYSAARSLFTVAATPGVVLSIAGPTTGVARVRKIVLTAKADGTNALSLTAMVQRSTTLSGGTSTSPTCLPHDTSDGAATCVVKAYTADPTVSGTNTPVRVATLTAAATTGGQAEFNFGQNGEKPLMLRAGEFITVTFSAGSLGSWTATSAFSVAITWDEGTA